MYEQATGYCLDWNSDGIPELDECEVERVSDQIFLLPYDVGEEGFVEKRYHNLAFGVDFFYNLLPAYTALHEAIVAAQHELRLTLSRLEGELERVKMNIERERGNDASSKL